MNSERIVLGGFAGSGKSTIGKKLAEKLGYVFILVGNFSREYAMKEFGLSINKFQEKCREDPSLDKLIDAKFQAMCNSTSKIVVDYRLGFKFIENAFSVFLEVSDDVAAERLLADKSASRNKEQIDADSISKRNREMRDRFKGLYGLDFADKANYDFSISTDNLSPEAIADRIIEELG